MIRRIASLAVVLGMGLTVSGVTTTQTGCSWFQGNKDQVVTDLGQIASCVFAQLLQGVTDPLKIAGACTPATMADAEQIIESIINFYDQMGVEAGAVAVTTSDAGASASNQKCGSGKAPYANMPQCVSMAQYASFKTAQVNVKAQRAQGAK